MAATGGHIFRCDACRRAGSVVDGHTTPTCTRRTSVASGVDELRYGTFSSQSTNREDQIVSYGANVYDYRRGLAEGYTFDEMRDIAEHEGDPRNIDYYIELRKAGVSHQDLVDVVSNDGDLCSYGDGISGGASHSDLIEGLRSKPI